MFALRGITVAFSVFVVVYCTMSLAVGFCWRWIHIRAQHHPSCRIANFLFAVRMFPLLTAALITAAFTVPSFVLLEPRAINEPLGDIPLALAIGGAVLGLFGMLNAATAVRKASRTVSTWTRTAQPVESTAPVPVLRIFRRIPAMTAAGILHPRVLLSSSTEFMLNDNELRTALNHEVAHVRHRDNLKKLLLRFVAFPGMRRLETAWLEATEMAADDAAVFTTSEALDLAAALIKVSSLRAVEPHADFTAALIHGPSSVMNARVERLIAWSAERQAPARILSVWCGMITLATLTLFVLTYSQLLVRVHTATEWLVR
jgi:Zn-dependent protease with chaperone function